MRTAPVAVARMAWTRTRPGQCAELSNCPLFPSGHCQEITSSPDSVSKRSTVVDEGDDSLSAFPEDHVDGTSRSGCMYTSSLHPRAGLNPAWVSGSRSSSPPSADALRRQRAACTSGRGGRSHDSCQFFSRRPFLCSIMNVPCTNSRVIRSEYHDHAAYAEKFIRSVHGPSLGFYGHVVTPRRFATA